MHRRSAYEAPGLLEPSEGHHGPNCEAPGHAGDVTHPIDNVYDAVYQCANHIMTSLRADDYGLIVLTPPALLDFSAGEATVRFDISTLSVSRRDWFSVAIQAYEDNLALPLKAGWPDLNGHGRNAIDFEFHDNRVCPVVYRNFVASEGKDIYRGSCQWWKGYDEVLTPSAQTRTTVEITVSRNRVRVSLPDHDLVWDDLELDDLGWDLALVSFLHHSYTPFKSGNGGPNTWHWDNVSIAPSKALTILPGDKRWVNEDNARVAFSKPAPAGSHLRGSAIGTQLEVSVDGGATWAVTTRQASAKMAQPTWQFWHPIPAGTRDILLRAGLPQPNWWRSAWIAKDISIFAPTQDEVAPPAPPKDCYVLRRVYEKVDNRWRLLQNADTAYSASDCIAEQPE